MPGLSKVQELIHAAQSRATLLVDGFESKASVFHCRNTEDILVREGLRSCQRTKREVKEGIRRIQELQARFRNYTSFRYSHIDSGTRYYNSEIHNYRFKKPTHCKFNLSYVRPGLGLEILPPV